MQNNILKILYLFVLNLIFLPFVILNLFFILLLLTLYISYLCIGHHIKTHPGAGGGGFCL